MGFGTKRVGRRLPRRLRKDIEEVVEAVPLDFGGGSSANKAFTFAELILANDLTRYVEIGVYRGRSLLPVAAVFRYRGRGTAIGIDPWSVSEAVQGDVSAFPAEAATVNDFVKATDWDALYQEVADRVRALDLTPYCQLVRATASDAAASIPDHSVGLLHIDGNHDADAVRRDLEEYLPKVKAGGFLMLDDASWATVQPTLEFLREHHEHIETRREASDDFALFRISASA